MESWSWPPAYDDSYRPDAGAEHWFPRRETMPPEERDEEIVNRIRELMGYAQRSSEFYRRKWADAGIDPQDIKTLADFEMVPTVEKEEIRADQAENPPFGSYLCVDPGEVHHVHGTSGTTGRPTAFGIDRRDWISIANAHARVMWGMGIRPADTVFIGAFFSLYMGSWAVLTGAERLGATVFPFGAGAPGQTMRAVQWMSQMKPSVFYGTPSYALHLAETALDEGVEPASLGLRRMFFSGEPGASIPAIREKIEGTFDALVFDAGSMAEVTPWMNLAETSSRVGMLCWQDIVYTEVVDPESNRLVPYGGEGTPVYTTLERTSQPMIRLRSNDLTRWEAPSSPCGRTYPILPDGVYGRIDDMFIVRGENIYPSAIDEAAASLDGYGGEHRAIVSRDESMDRLVVQVEVVDTVLAGGSEAVDEWCAKAARRIGAMLGIGVRVSAVPRHTFERTQMKANRVVDDRDLWRSLSN